MIERNEKTAELVGLSFGDGGLTYRTGTKRLRFQLRGSLRDDKEHYDTYVTQLFNQEVMAKLFGEQKVGIVFNKNAGFYGISKESEKLKMLNEVLGIPIGVKRELFIPEWIKINKKFMNAFLRGFFDTDGCIFCQKNYSIKNNTLHTQIRITLASCSKNLISEIYEYLKSIRFKCLFRTENKERYGWNNLHTIVISGGIQVNRWMNEIGSNNPKHITKYQLWKEYGFCPPFTSLEERKQMLKKEISPNSYYTRGCRSGQTGMRFLENENLPS